MPAYSDQEEKFARAFAVLQKAIEARAFPGAATAVIVGRDLVAWKAFGRYTYEADSPIVTAESVWDLASVSKVVATTAAAMILHERGVLDLNAPLESAVPEFNARSHERRRQVTLRMLLAHSSGLPAYYRLYETASSPQELLATCFGIPLEADPGSRTEYSDIGFILLGVALERLSKESLGSLCRREVYDRLDLREILFNPPMTWRDRIPPTEDDQRFRRRVIQGEVNDENAWVLGGVAGHAGVFSTVLDVARFGQHMLGRGIPLVRPETMQTFMTRQAYPAGTSRALGWDTPSPPSQSGRYFGAKSFGHLGFTGTSLWCDPEQQLCVVLLTNRTWPDRGSLLIKRFRPLFHDLVVECLNK